MGLISEGSYLARAISGGYGKDDNGYRTARVDFELLAGPDKGQRITYNGRIDNRSAPYVGKDLQAIGWRGDLDRLSADIEATHLEAVIQIEHKDTKDGARKFAVVRSIGRGAKPLAKATRADVDEANALLRDALGGAPADDVPHAANGRDDIPFVSAARADEPRGIARVIGGAP